MARVATGELFACLRERVKERGITDVDVCGRTGGTTPYREAPEEGAMRSGFEARLQGPSIMLLQPVYVTKSGAKMGEWHGKAPAKAITGKARPGYVVGSSQIRASLRLDAFALKLVKLGKDRLQPDNHYSSV